MKPIWQVTNVLLENLELLEIKIEALNFITRPKNAIPEKEFETYDNGNFLGLDIYFNDKLVTSNYQKIEENEFYSELELMKKFSMIELDKNLEMGVQPSIVIDKLKELMICLETINDQFFIKKIISNGRSCQLTHINREIEFWQSKSETSEFCLHSACTDLQHTIRDLIIEFKGKYSFLINENEININKIDLIEVVELNVRNKHNIILSPFKLLNPKDMSYSKLNRAFKLLKENSLFIPNDSSLSNFKQLFLKPELSAPLIWKGNRCSGCYL